MLFFPAPTASSSLFVAAVFFSVAVSAAARTSSTPTTTAAAFLVVGGGGCGAGGPPLSTSSRRSPGRSSSNASDPRRRPRQHFKGGCCRSLSTTASTPENDGLAPIGEFKRSSPLLRTEPPPTRNARRQRIAVLEYRGGGGESGEDDSPDDGGFVCINKPAGMSVHRRQGSGGRKPKNNNNNNEPTVRSALKRQLSRKVWPVHRLDHRTSGAMLWAFTPAACAALHSALRSPGAKKRYVALLRGDWKASYPTREVANVDAPLDVDGVPKNCTTVFRYVASVPSFTARRRSDGTENNNSDDDRGDGDGDDDASRFFRYDGACTLVVAEPRTGRRHQIRRHAARARSRLGLGMPVLGDTEHGDTKVNRWWRRLNLRETEERNTGDNDGRSGGGLDRLALHCSSLQLTYRRFTGKEEDNHNDDDDETQHTEEEEGGEGAFDVDIVAPLPDDLLRVFRHPGLSTMWSEAQKREPRLFGSTDWIDFRGGTLADAKKKKAWQIEREKDYFYSAYTGRWSVARRMISPDIPAVSLLYNIQTSHHIL